MFKYRPALLLGRIACHNIIFGFPLSGHGVLKKVLKKNVTARTYKKDSKIFSYFCVYFCFIRLEIYLEIFQDKEG